MTQTVVDPTIQDLDEYGYPTRPDAQRKLRNAVVHTSRHLLLGGISLALGGVGAYLKLRAFGQAQPPLSPQTFHPKRILVIRVDLIGDLVMSMTVVRQLKRTYPEAEIDLLAIPSSASIVRGDPDITQLLTYDPNIWRRPKALLQTRNWREAQALRQQMRERDYDLAVSVSGPWASILSVLSRAPRRVGFGAEGYPGFMTESVPGRHWAEGERKHEVDYCMELLHACGATLDQESRVPTLHVTPKSEQEVADLLQVEGIDPQKPLVACQVSSHNGYAKRWPIPYWARLIERLVNEDGMNVVLTGAPKDQPLIEAVLKRTRAHMYNFAGKTNLPQLAALLKRADIVISGDSGPMHIAAAVGSELIAIHGPTDPQMSGPVSPHATVLRSDIWCSPCYFAKGPANCRFHTTQCMKDISPEQVHSAVLSKLEGARIHTQESSQSLQGGNA
ncbi:ADP-heptose--LPS heptosyltransferase [Ktedonobacter sp. SOSP1-52]|uniref:lipopolysaccharide heptosyltransferase II n=1 Tax=Ktedonobacter sp. SOSP1-52 TaxID=2778366 RepID=UPI001915E00D|nr:lipopolysaccharide heptosyltransferase II [Ktedonobacter sp. SOSP1-52]GHO67010.1 ADP-heptose--LPS heptosyltransferase [Ktedonobacter sp. SOSP1-52]